MSNDSTSSTGPVFPDPPRSFAAGARPFSSLTKATESAVPTQPGSKRPSGPVTRADNRSAVAESGDESNGNPKSAQAASNRELDSQLIHQTKSQIRVLVQEIAALAQSGCDIEEFFEGFLTRTTNALASQGGAVWLRDSTQDAIKLQYQINLKQTVLATDPDAQNQHSKLLNRLLQQREPTLISPHSGGDDTDQAGNPTASLLVVGPLIIDQEIVGLVEILQRPGAGPTTQRGYLRFVAQMSEIASDYLRNHRIRLFAQQQAMWQQLEQFIRSVHQGLDTKQTIYTIANEGRRLTGSDRLSVAVGTGRNCRIEAVSGLDSIERRAEQVKKLGSLASTVIRTGQPLWYNGDDTDLPPQIESRLHAYVDKSHAKMVAIVPLKENHAGESAQAEDQRSGKLLGALILEQLKDSEITESLRQRTDVLVSHSETALTNALEHNRIFLMPLWKLLGKLTSAFGTGKRSKDTDDACLCGCLAVVFGPVPLPFRIGRQRQPGPGDRARGIRPN